MADKVSKQPFEPSLKIDQLIKQQAMNLGLMCYPGSGTIDGVRGNHILLAPAFILQSNQVQEIVERLGQAIDAAFKASGITLD